MTNSNKIYYHLKIWGDIIKSIAKTVIFVTAFSVIERFLGFVYRIYLSRTIGSEGLGLYQITLTVFGLLLTITSSGIPITVSRMMTRYSAENNPKAVQSTVTAGILLSLILSTAIATVFFLFNNYLSFIFSDPRCMDILLIIMPGLIITSVYAVLRGFFWGNKDFVPYSVIELLEEAVMLIAGILLINRSTSVLSDVHRAAWAVLISYVFSFTSAWIVFFIRKGKLNDPLPVLRQLTASAAPITGTRTTTSLINSLIAVILPAMLIASGLSKEAAVSSFGAAYGMAMPILFMPGTLIGSLAIVLVPELSTNFYKKQSENLKRNIERAIKFSAFVACMIIPVLFSFGKKLGIFFYDSEEAGIYLSVFAPIMLPMSLTMISTSMLNSLNRERKTLLYYLCGAIFMLASIFLLPKFIGIYALAVGMFGQFAITASLNLFELKRATGSPLNYSKYIFTAIMFFIPSYLFGIMLNNVLSSFLPNAATCIIGCIAVAAFNFTLFVVFGMIDFLKKEDSPKSHTIKKDKSSVRKISTDL